MTVHSPAYTVLRLSMTFGETSAPYNQFSLPLIAKHKITLCSYLPVTVKPPAEIRVFAGDGTLLGFVSALNKALDGQRYDIVHVHDAVVANLFMLAVPTMNASLFSSSIFTVHNSYENFKPRNRLLLMPIFATYRKVICCSKASYQSFPNFYRRLAGKRLTYVQNGMDIERLDRVLRTKATPIAEQSDFTIISIGRLIDIKNPLMLVNAFAQSNLPQSRLVFVGAGPLANMIQAQAQAAGIADRVELTGLIPRDEVYQRMSAADLFVSTSYGEGLPIAVLEAMACRKPVILSDIPPHREIVDNHAFIPLIGADDMAGFAQAMRASATMTVEQRKIIGERARKIVDDNFSLTSMHRGYDAIYDQVSRPTGQSQKQFSAR